MAGPRGQVAISGHDRPTGPARPGTVPRPARRPVAPTAEGCRRPSLFQLAHHRAAEHPLDHGHAHRAGVLDVLVVGTDAAVVRRDR